MAVVSTKCSGLGASRITRQINGKPASHFHHAIRIADAIGLPLTHLVTIHLTSCPPEEASARFAKLRSNLFGKWISRPLNRGAVPACPPTFVWVIENESKILHAHWLLHIPAGRVKEFTRKLPVWVESVTGSAPYAGGIHIHLADTPEGAGKYMQKGIDPFWGKVYRINFSDQGPVHGKRSGYSRNIGPTAKKRLRDAGQYRKAQKWVPGRWSTESRPT